MDEKKPSGHSHNRRSLHDHNQLNIQGNHDSRKGAMRIWQSQNGRNEIQAFANYNQHVGGPPGRSPPSYGGGVIFIHRF